MYILSWVVVRHRDAPVIVAGPSNATVNAGDTLTLRCDVFSDDPYHIQWLKEIIVNSQTNETRNYSVIYVSDSVTPKVLIDVM